MYVQHVHKCGLYNRSEPNLFTNLPIFPSSISPIICPNYLQMCVYSSYCLCSIKLTFIPSQHKRFSKAIVKCSSLYLSLYCNNIETFSSLQSSCLAVDQMRHLLKKTFSKQVTMAERVIPSEVHAFPKREDHLHYVFTIADIE